MSDWWNALTPLLQVLYGLAIFSTVVLIVQTMLLFAGVGRHDLATGDLEHGGAGDHPSGLSLLSARTITAFLAGFGWTGVIVLTADGGQMLALILATIAGLALAAMILWLMRNLRRLAHEGSRDLSNAIGLVATVYVTVPPHAGVGGQVEILVQGQLCTVAAISHGETPIAPGTKVRAAELVDRNTLVVTNL
ncbi:MAG: hypothetical protein AAB263_21825 [Planctomycetota bacterium]